MKNSFQAALLVICAILSSCGSNKTTNSLEEADLKGNVRSVLTIYYDGIDKFGEGQIVKGSPKFFGSSYQTFDSTGFITTKKEFLISDCYKSAENVYDKDGRWIKWTSYEKGGKVKYSNEYEYDEHGNKLLERDLVDRDVTRYKNTYDENGRLTQVVKKYETIIYQYNEKGQLVRESERYSYLGTLTNEYEYDDAGNLIKHIWNGYSGKKSYYFYKYDSSNRQVASIECNSDDPDAGKVLSKRAMYYVDNTATEPYMVKTWDEDGKLSKTSYRVFFASQKDTLSIVELGENYTPSWISVQARKGQNLVSTGYDITSSVLFDNTYNYIDGRLASIRDDDGNVTSYVYKNKDLVSVTQELSKGKIISNYKSGKLVNRVTYDSHNKPESTRAYEYKGNSTNGTISCTATDKDNKTEIIATTYKDGKIIEEVVTRNGLSITSKYSYNAEGYVSQISSSDGTNSEFTYQYDAFGNWFQRTEKQGDDITIIERKIDYYL